MNYKGKKERLNLEFFFGLKKEGAKAMIDWCMNVQLIAATYACVCGRSMNLTERKDVSDGYAWLCRNDSEKHYVRRSVRKGSWFEKSRLDMCDILLVTVMWVKDAPHKFIYEDLGLSKQTVTDWMSFCREVCVKVLLNDTDMIGGVGVTVEIDESKFGKRKYNRGKRVEGKWVFGGIERGTNKCFLRVVEDRKASTLCDIVKECVLPGTCIISDCWKAYEKLDKEGFQHFTVNHSITFKDPETGAHTNSIEGTWGAIKRSLKGSNSVRDQFETYLAEYMWRRRHSDLSVDGRIDAFISAIKKVYSPPGKDVVPDVVPVELDGPGPSKKSKD